MGVKPTKKEKGGKKDKKDKKVEKEEPKIQEVPAEINYSFDDHTEDCEIQPQMIFPIVQQPNPTTIIGNSHNMC